MGRRPRPGRSPLPDCETRELQHNREVG